MSPGSCSKTTRPRPASHDRPRGAKFAPILLPTPHLLIDELAGRAEAERRHLVVTGTVGVLAEAHVAGLLDFDQAVVKLRQTNFYLSEKVVAQVPGGSPTQKAAHDGRFPRIRETPGK